MCEPAYGPRLHGEGYIDSIYGYLWSKSLKSQLACPYVSLPHTVIYKHGAIAQWFHTANDGQLERRRKTYLKSEDVLEMLGANGRLDDPHTVIAQFITPPADDDDAKSGIAAKIEYWNYAELCDFLEREPKPTAAILQAFVSPNGPSNHILRAFWSPSMLMLEQRDNKYTLDDTHVTMSERCCTFDGASHLTEEVPARDKSLIQEVERQLRAVSEHIIGITTGRAKIARMVVFFKLGADGRVWLLWCDSLSLSESGNSPNKPINSASSAPQSMPRKNWLQCQRCEAHGSDDFKQLPLKSFVQPALDGSSPPTLPLMVRKNFPKLTSETFARLQHDAVFLSTPVMVCRSCFVEVEKHPARLAEPPLSCFYAPHQAMPSIAIGSAHSTAFSQAPSSRRQSVRSPGRHSVRSRSKCSAHSVSTKSRSDFKSPWLEMPGIKVHFRPTRTFLGNRMPKMRQSLK